MDRKSVPLPSWAALEPSCIQPTDGAQGLPPPVSPHKGRTDPKDPLLSVEEVATYLAVSPKTVRRLIAVGAIAVFRVGRSIRVPPKELQRFLDSSTASSPGVVLNEKGDE